MKIAIIGSGISGNVAAYYLNREHEITVFEANDYIGGHTHTHDIEHKGKRYVIDTGFIVFNYRTYQNFIELLDTLRVDVQPSVMSFSVKSETDGLEYSGNTLNSLFAQRRNLFKPSFHRMLIDILRFNREALEQSRFLSDDLTLGQFLTKQKYSRGFIEKYIIPMGAAIWSTVPEQIHDFPARFFIQFFHNHGLLNSTNRPTWYVIKSGSREYVKPLVGSYRNKVRLNSPIERIRRFPGHVEITVRGCEPENFDAVFIAAHADQALNMLERPTVQETQVLSAFPYQQNEAVLHTDTRLLPQNHNAWASWNYYLPKQNKDRVTLTYNMNILQALHGEDQFLVTLNNSQDIDESKIIKRIEYHHPTFTAASISAQRRHSEINATLRTFYCGAYWRNGFHEDGVVSAQQAIKDFNEFCNEQLYLPRAS
jgi:predicted NAD/FAD-binding protein